MFTPPVLEQAKKMRVLPRLLATHQLKTKPYCQTKNQQQYHLFGNQFASLATTDDFLMSSVHAIEVDITEEMTLLKENHSLEVSVPALGVVDLCSDSPWRKKAPSFATILSINGLRGERPEHILVTDIAGNQYEILIEANGEIILPEEGIGIFSLISYITFIFSKAQLMKGAEMGRNKLVILPIPESKSAFKMHVSVVHFNELNQRSVETIRQIEITYQDLHIAHDQKIVNVTAVGEGYPGLYQVKMGILLLAPFLVNKQLIATIRLENPDEITDNLFLHGWHASLGKASLYTKRFGLSVSTLTLVVKTLYPLLDFVKDYLSGDHFGLSQKNGYNNFLLHFEVLAQFYDRLIHDLINQTLSGKFLFKRIRPERLETSHLSSLSEDEHDKAVLHELESEMKNHHFTPLKRLFLTDDEKEPVITDFFHVNWPFSLNVQSIPQATLLVTQDQHSMNEIVESLQSGGYQAMSPWDLFEEDDFSTENPDPSLNSTFHLEEIVDNFEGFHTTYRSRNNPWTALRPSQQEPKNKRPRNRP